MRYVERDVNGKINGSYANRQPGYAEELVADNHPDLIEFLKPKPLPLPTPLQELEEFLKAKPSRIAALKALLP